jgi:hypothetical protein
MPELVGTGSGAARPGGESGQRHAAADTAFALGRSCGGTARLPRQVEELAPESRVLLERTALGPGQQAIDIGCGPAASSSCGSSSSAPPGGWPG